MPAALAVRPVPGSAGGMAHRTALSRPLVRTVLPAPAGRTAATASGPAAATTAGGPLPDGSGRATTRGGRDVRNVRIVRKPAVPG
nr:hypothetical protein OH820_10980 [Streptomyces sp. NBC_00857]